MTKKVEHLFLGIVVICIFFSEVSFQPLVIVLTAILFLIHKSSLYILSESSAVYMYANNFFSWILTQSYLSAAEIFNLSVIKFIMCTFSLHISNSVFWVIRKILHKGHKYSFLCLTFMRFIIFLFLHMILLPRGNLLSV